jgi:Mrp family chromosome partitioning ATPase
MGRMFRIISDRHENTQGVRPGYLIADAIPYVEVGGPEGVVTSIPSPKPVTRVEHVVREIPVVKQPVYTQPVYHPVNLAADQRHFTSTVYQPVYTQPVYQPHHLSVQLHRTATHTPVTAIHHAPASDVVQEVVAYHHPEHGISNEYRVMRDEIRQMLTEIGSKSLYFTSARQHSGTTTVLLNLAATLAHDSNETKVIVVDADFDAPASARRLAAGQHQGLSDVLGQDVPLAWAIQPTGVPRVQVLSSGMTELRPAAATELPRLVAQLKQWFDWVLIDGGRWGQRNDRDAIVSTVDGTFAVTRSTDLERVEFTNLRNSIAHSGGQLRGYITTRM